MISAKSGQMASQQWIEIRGVKSDNVSAEISDFGVSAFGAENFQFYAFLIPLLSILPENTTLSGKNIENTRILESNHCLVYFYLLLIPPSVPDSLTLRLSYVLIPAGT